MPTYNFTDQDNIGEIAEPGDYVLRVNGVNIATSKGKATKGSDVVVLEMLIEQTGSHFQERLTIHQSCFWKIDTFIKAFNYRMPNGSVPKKGEPVNLTAATLIGLRGWATLDIEEYEKTAGGKGKKNTIVQYLTHAERLPRATAEEMRAGDSEAGSSETGDSPGNQGSAPQSPAIDTDF